MKEVKKPWGNFKQFVLNKKCTVKIIEVNSGEELSLQKHKHREELWYFLEPAAVYLKNKKIKVKEGSIINVRKNTPHQIFAPGKKTRLLEISFGKFDENDIIRLSDKYGRK
jgi:mannose-1-phosphate guanylyltransferase/mannose-6-phosphate isomerase